MAWVTLTEAELHGQLSAAELGLVRQSARPGQPDPVTAALADAVELARGYAAAVMAPGAAGTVPAQLRGAVLAIARWRVLSRLPSGKDLLTDARRVDHDEAQKLLREVAAGRFALDPAIGAAPASAPAARPALSTGNRTRAWTRAAQRGL
jgi:anti-sigma factor ChrR (cupin superfamily)